MRFVVDGQIMSFDRQRQYSDTEIYDILSTGMNNGQPISLDIDGVFTRVKSESELWFASRIYANYHGEMIYTPPENADFENIWTSQLEKLLEESSEEESEAEDYDAEEFRPTLGSGKRCIWEAKRCRAHVQV